jgi:O-antigen/teichoic acid export membrane protein
MMNPTPNATAPTPPSAASNLASDATFSMLARLLYLVTRLGLPPLILAHVTLAEYGLWSACSIVIGYIGMADLGLSTVYVRSASRLHAARDTVGIGRMLSTGMTLMAGVALLLLGAILSLLPMLMDSLKIDEAGRSTGQILIIGAVVIFLLDMSLSGFTYTLHGMHHYRAEQRTWVGSFMLEMVLIVAFLLSGFGILSLMAAFVLRYIYSSCANMRLVYRFLPGLSVGLRHFDRSLLPGFFSVGIVVQASSLLAIGLASADRVVAGLILGPSSLALFDIGAKLPGSAMSLPSAISQITMPAAARLSQVERPAAPNWRHDPLLQLYAKSTRSVILLASLMGSFIAAFSAPLSLAWLGPRAGLEVLPLLMALTACSATLHISTGPGSAVFRGSGRLGNEFIYHGLRIVMLALAVGVVYWIIGVSVAALGIALALGLCGAALLYMAHNHRTLGLPLAHLATQFLLPALLQFAIGGVLYLGWLAFVPPGIGRWVTLALLAPCGLLHCTLCCTALWRLLDGDERSKVVSVINPVMHRLGRFQPVWSQP